MMVQPMQPPLRSVAFSVHGQGRNADGLFGAR